MNVVTLILIMMIQSGHYFMHIIVSQLATYIKQWLKQFINFQVGAWIFEKYGLWLIL